MKRTLIYAAIFWNARARCFSVQNSQSGNINISCEGRGAYSSTGTISVNNQDVELYEVWKSGDKVLVIPDGKNEKFFIVDVLEGA
jgi:hypothetical protein